MMTSQLTLPIEESLTLLPLALPVKTLAKQEGEKVSKAIALIFSSMPRDLSKKSDPWALQWKTCEGLIAGSHWYSIDLPKSGVITSSGLLYRLPNLEDVMFAIAGSVSEPDLPYLPTPLASNRMGDRPDHYKPKQGKKQSKRVGYVANRKGHKLSPEFVEKMMGFPDGWTEIN